jgi:hypothetical protein
MRKISKKFIPINFIKILSEKDINFYLVSTNNILIDKYENSNILIYKKGLYRYLLPGKFVHPVKTYFKYHTYINYINFDLNKDLIKSLIINKDIILFNYKGYIFFNNSLIFRYLNQNLMFDSFYNLTLNKYLLLFSIIYLTNN